jgi:hypothetical protein
MLGTLGVTGCEAMSVQDQFFFPVDSDSEFCSHGNKYVFTLSKVIDLGSWFRLYNE